MNRMKKSVLLLAVGIAALVFAAVALAATTVVWPGNMDGWAFQTSGTATAQMVNGPSSPPGPTGSAEFKIGTDGDSAAQLRYKPYNGLALSSITALSYSTFVVDPRPNGTPNTGQAPYIILNVDRDGNGTLDDLLFFEPLYSDGTYNGSFNQQSVAYNTWQTWDALNGGWYGIDSTTFNPSFAGPGTDVQSLSAYKTANPNALIYNSLTTGSIRVLGGFGAGAWDNFVGNVDNFTINGTTFNFELNAPLVGPPTTKAQCNNGGWQTFNSPRPFKNQGDCIQFVNTGK